MLFSRIPNSLLGLSALLLIRPVVAGLIPDVFQNLDILQGLEKRCSNPCGYYGQLCCASGEYCYTDSAGQAQCGASSAATTNGQWVYYTTTYVMTDLKTATSTYSSYVGVQTAAATTTVTSCVYAQGQTPCGNVCCLSGQYCQTSGTCVAVPGGSSGYYSSLYTVTTVVTNTASAALRPTTQTVLTLTSTSKATATTAYSTPVGTGGAILSGTTASSGGLSGGAIAGIVIGVIAGILLLLLICACFCFKGLIDGLLGIFGLGGDRRRKRTEEVYIEERHSRRSSAGGRKWYGQPGRTEVIDEKKESSGIKRMVGVAAVLGGLAAALGLKRRNDRRDSVSDVSGSSYDDYSSESSPSSVTRSRSRARPSR